MNTNHQAYVSFPATGHLNRPPAFSPLVLADRLISLAQDADRAGFPGAATSLLGLLDTVMDENRVANYQVQ